ncbi:MAG: PilT/PilU family type 4a pilus ATPase [Actinobacteria bacterium]|nr:PilT/PilU family type 4a pilus ATPase [Actinomycetota bacterium]
MRPELLDILLSAVVERGGTDMLLTTDAEPLIRIGGTLVTTPGFTPLGERAMWDVFVAMVDDNQRAQLDADRDLDFAFSFGDARFRGNAFFERGRLAIALRLMHRQIPTFDEIGLPYPVRELASLNQGLVLFTGPTGSGKSTSMATLVDEINAKRACHIITIEDPVEYLHVNRQAVVHQREIGLDAQSFERALRAALREDPDVVLVGEMRDLESIAITMRLAETGHLVLSSLHTNDAAQALDRIVDVFPAERQSQIRLQLASVLSAVVAQRLIPSTAGELVAAYEVLVVTPAVSNLLREGKTRQIRNAMQLGVGSGNQTLEMSLNSLLHAGTITPDVALATAFVPHEIAVPQPAHA